jgi:hypothetical protein
MGRRTDRANKRQKAQGGDSQWVLEEEDKFEAHEMDPLYIQPRHEAGIVVHHYEQGYDDIRPS